MDQTRGSMDYVHLMQKALKMMVKETLKCVEEHGLFGLSYFYITFKPTFQGAFIPKYLLEKYPDKMTIVLQHEFWDLHVYDTYFSVSLLFNNTLENLKIPFNSIYRFEDPNEPLALDFFVAASEEETITPESDDNIISLDTFRKNKEPQN